MSRTNPRNTVRNLNAINGFLLDGVAVTKTAAELNAGATGTQASHLADAETAHDVNSTFADTEVEAALDALGTKINAIIDALEAYGIMAAS